MFGKKLGDAPNKRPLSLRLYNRFFHKYNSHDINYELQVIARKESAAYVKDHMPDANMYQNRWLLLEAALAEAKPDGLFLECGVEKGDSTNFIARLIGSERRIHAFDSFEGLPEAWTGTFERAGKFSQKGRIPPMLPNVTVHKGWFADTMSVFAREHDGPISLIHIDCDLYSSTKDILAAVGDRIQPGTIVAFDEYFNYHNWQRHEFKAWQEFCAERGLAYAYRGFCARGGQVYVKIL